MPLVERLIGEIRRADLRCRHGRIELQLCCGDWTRRIADLIGAHAGARSDPPRATPVPMPDNINVAVIKACLDDLQINAPMPR